MDARKYALAVAVVLGMAGSLIGCAPAAAPAEAGSQNDANGVEAAWSQDADCTSCHEIEGNSAEDKACLMAFHGTTDCVTCHDDAATLQTVHEKAGDKQASSVKRLKKTEIKEETCLSCHGSWEELATKTASLTVLKDDNGTVVNPHDLPQNEDHKSLTCTTCHDMHKGEDASTEAPEQCLSCHHKNVYECYTCH